MVVVCTVLAAFAQVLLKVAAGHPMPPIHFSEPASILGFILALGGNLPLIFGYTLHAGNALLLILALRDGHLSVLYPVYSLSYIWVNLLSVWLFHEQMNGWKIGGVALIICGVGVLGRASSLD
jgi:multidrug transporter EmrE-like cation transporter